MNSIIEFYNKHESSLLSNYPESKSNTRYEKIREHKRFNLKLSNNQNTITSFNLSREGKPMVSQFGNLTLSNFPKHKYDNKVHVSKYSKRKTFYAKPSNNHQVDSYGIIYENEEKREGSKINENRSLISSNEVSFNSKEFKSNYSHSNSQEFRDKMMKISLESK